MFFNKNNQQYYFSTHDLLANWHFSLRTLVLPQIISFILLLFFSCTIPNYSKLKTCAVADVSNDSLLSVFPKSFTKALYKARLDVYGNYFTGMFFLKSMEDSSYRINFINEFGMKFFDIEYKNEKFKLIYCFEKFNNSILLNTLETDIRYMLQKKYKRFAKKIYCDDINKETIIQLGKDFYFTKTNSSTISKIEHCGSFKKKMELIPSNYKNGFPSSLHYQHFNIKFAMQLDIIEAK